LERLQLITNGISLLILVDVPRPDLNGLTCGGWYDWMLANFRCGVTTSISEVGAEIALTQAGLPTIATGETLPVTLEILEEQFLCKDNTQTGFSGEFPGQVLFDQVTLSQQRRLVEMLFCRPGSGSVKIRLEVAISVAAVEDIA